MTKKVVEFMHPAVKELVGFHRVWEQVDVVSPLGQKEKKRVTPYREKELEKLEEVFLRLELVVSVLKEDPQAHVRMLGLLREIRDVEGSLIRSKKGVTLDDVELFAIKQNIFVLQEMKNELLERNLALFMGEGWDFSSLGSLLHLGQEGTSFYIASAYHEGLEAVREERKAIEQAISREKRAVSQGIEEKIGRKFTVEDELTVSKEDTAMLSLLLSLDSLVRIRENFASVTFQLVESKEVIQLQGAKKKVREQEAAYKEVVRSRLTKEIGSFADALLLAHSQMGVLDLDLAKAVFAIKTRAVRPRLGEGITFFEGRHLVGEEEQEKRGLTYTPISLSLSKGVTLLTGPNMGGKTLTLKTVALLTAMAQHGLFVPASFFCFTPVHFIHMTLLENNLKSSLSNFGTEIYAIKGLLAGEEKGLLLLDELAHGTNPREGYAIAYALIKRLHTLSSLCLVTTHYERLTEQEEIPQYRVSGLDYALLPTYQRGQDVATILNGMMDYRIVPVEKKTPMRYDALFVAELMGLDKTIIEDARNVMDSKGGTQHHGETDVKA